MSHIHHSSSSSSSHDRTTTLEHWWTHVPLDPVHDVKQISELESSQRIKYANGVDPKTNLPAHFTPLQLCLAWDNDELCRQVMEELVLCGADVNACSLRGHNALHLLLFLFFYRSEHERYFNLLSWFLARGVDTNVACIMTRKDGQMMDIMTPLDILLLLYRNHLDVCVQYHFPPTLVYQSYQKISTVLFQKITLLLLLYGASTARQEDDYQEIETLKKKSWTSLHSLLPTTIRDYIIVRYKLPVVSHVIDALDRVHFLHKVKSFLGKDPEWIITKRNELLYHDDGSNFHNPHFEHHAEFMPYEYLSYRDHGTGKKFSFHKVMIPNIMKHRLNPFTRSPIDVDVLRKWFFNLGQSPLHFNQVFLQQEVLSTDLKNPLLTMKLPDRLDNRFEERQSLQHIHHVLFYGFPYTNILQLFTYSAREIRYLCHALSMNPYQLENFQSILVTNDENRKQPLLQLFWRVTMNYFITPEFPFQTFYFGIEESIQDISCYRLIKTILDSHHERLQKHNFLDLILRIPEIGDVIRDRLGYVHLGYFYEIWQRLVYFQDNF